MAACTIWGVL